MKNEKKAIEAKNDYDILVNRTAFEMKRRFKEKHTMKGDWKKLKESEIYENMVKNMDKALIMTNAKNALPTSSSAERQERTQFLMNIIDQLADASNYCAMLIYKAAEKI